MSERKPRWCQRHWSPCPTEGLNGLMVTVRLAQAFAEDPRVFEYTQGKVANLEAAAEHFAPLCCFLGEAAMERLWDEARAAKGRDAT